LILKKQYELSKNEASALKFIKKKSTIRRKDLQKYLGISERTARRILSKLERLGLIKKHGSGSNIYYTPA